MASSLGAMLLGTCYMVGVGGGVLSYAQWREDRLIPGATASQ